MKDISELHDTLRGLVSVCSGLDENRIILANQGRSPPKGEALYATYNPVPVRAYGQPSQTVTPAGPHEAFDANLGADWQDLAVITATSMEFMLSVNFFNDGAAQAAMLLHNANFRPPVSAYLFRHALAFRYVSNPRNLSAHFQAQIQPRWQADIFLFVNQEVSSDILRAAGFTLDLLDC